jgi:hypothetical protein
LLAKESIGLPDIIKILGDRPFPMKETVREYLQEMMERKDKEDSEKTKTASEEEKKEEGSATPTTEEVKKGDAESQQKKE